MIDLHEPAAEAWKAKLEQKFQRGRLLTSDPVPNPRPVREGERQYWSLREQRIGAAGTHLPAAPNIAFPTETGYRTRHSHFYNDHWKPAIKALGWTLTPHDLRHTAASLMIRHGAPAQYVQHQLGHANPTITLNTYSHLFEDQSVEVNERMNQAYREAK